MTSLTYRDAGVNIDAGDALVDRIKPFARRTMRPEVLGSIGGFGALFELSKKYREPVLVSGTDGVGTKLRLAFELKRHDTIGQDLVAMSVNDILVQGAEPLFFLDYFACGKLDVDTATDVIKGVARGCELAGCALIGGETAEMPSMYPEGEYDLAGFAVGAVEKADIIDGSKIAAGDVVLGLASSGAHSNGYSLIRKVIEVSGVDLSAEFHGRTLADAVLEPTRIYVKPLLALMQAHAGIVHGMAHITGGGSAAIKAIPDDIIEAARIDGTSVWSHFRHITLPSVWPTLMVVLITISVQTLKVFDIVRTMTGGQYETSVIANEMYAQAFRYGELGMGSALAVFLFVLVIPLVIVQMRTNRRLREEQR